MAADRCPGRYRDHLKWMLCARSRHGAQSLTKGGHFLRAAAAQPHSPRRAPYVLYGIRKFHNSPALSVYRSMSCTDGYSTSTVIAYTYAGGINIDYCPLYLHVHVPRARPLHMNQTLS